VDIHPDDLSILLRNAMHPIALDVKDWPIFRDFSIKNVLEEQLQGFIIQ